MRLLFGCNFRSSIFFYILSLNSYIYGTLPYIGLSDRLSIELNSKSRTTLPQSMFKVKSRDLRQSNRLALSRYLEIVDIPTLIKDDTTCSEKVSMLETIINIGLDTISPIRTKTIYSNERSWINPTLKSL